MKEKQEEPQQEHRIAPQGDMGVAFPASLNAFVSNKIMPLQRKVTHLSTSKGSADLHDHGSAAKLYNLEVGSAKRGGGGGKELVHKASQEALEMGKKKLVLDSQDNGSGKLDSWYKKQGFKSAGKNNGMNSFELPLQRKEAPANIKKSEKPPLQFKAENRTGLPDTLKTKMESTFGHQLGNIRINPNSSLPAKVGAIATTQRNRIDFAPGHYNPHTSQGQKLIGHEAWHTVQQAQGRVKPTLQMKTGYLVNDNAALEKEADVMGEKVVKFSNTFLTNQLSRPVTKLRDSTIQRSVANPKKDDSAVQDMLTDQYWKEKLENEEFLETQQPDYWDKYGGGDSSESKEDDGSNRTLADIVKIVGKKLLTDLADMDPGAPQLKLYRKMEVKEAQNILGWFASENAGDRRITEDYIMQENSDLGAKDISKYLKKKGEGRVMPISGHLGGWDQVKSYTEESQGKKKNKKKKAAVILEFVLKPGAHELLFSPEYLAIARTGRGATSYLTKQSAEVYQAGDEGEGNKAGYIGMKSEDRGPFSINMGKSAPTHLLFQLMIADIKVKEGGEYL